MFQNVSTLKPDYKSNSKYFYNFKKNNSMKLVLIIQQVLVKTASIIHELK